MHLVAKDFLQCLYMEQMTLGQTDAIQMVTVIVIVRQVQVTKELVIWWTTTDSVFISTPIVSILYLERIIILNFFKSF